MFGICWEEVLGVDIGGICLGGLSGGSEDVVVDMFGVIGEDVWKLLVGKKSVKIIPAKDPTEGSLVFNERLLRVLKFVCVFVRMCRCTRFKSLSYKELILKAGVESYSKSFL